MRYAKILTWGGALLLLSVAVHAAELQHVRMRSGDVFVGQVLERNDQHVVIQHPLLGRVELPADQVAAVEAPGSMKPAPPKPSAEPGEAPDAPAPAAKPAEAPKPEAKPEAKPAPKPAAAPAPKPAAKPAVAEKPKEKGFIDKFLEEWKLRFKFGLSSRDSNTDTKNVNTSLSAKYADKKDRWDVNVTYFYQKTNQSKSREDVHVALRKDWLFPDSPWFVFTTTEWDYDQYKSWDHRLSVHGGIGYDLKDFLGLQAELRAGGGVTKEFGGVDPKFRPESLFASELTWNIDKKHKISGSVEIFPSVNDEDEYRIRTKADWTYKFTQNVGLSIGYWNEYDSAVPDGYEKNDTRIFGSVVFDF